MSRHRYETCTSDAKPTICAKGNNTDDRDPGRRRTERDRLHERGRINIRTSRENRASLVVIKQYYFQEI